MVRTALTSEREGDDIQGIQDRGASTKRKEDQSSPNLGKKQKTSVSQGYQGQGYGHQGQGQDQLFRGGEHFEALASQSREHVTTATSLDTFEGIAHGGRDPKVVGHLSPNRRWDELGLPVRMGRWCATIANNPNI